jgi:hypothetical protein
LRFIDLTGYKTGRLTVISRAATSRNKKTQWNCLCECGKMIVVCAGPLRKGQQSCNCEQYAKIAKPDAALNRIMSGYTRHAKRRGFDWQLTLEDFRTIISLPCCYCGAAPKNAITRCPRTIKTIFYYSGVDRADNTMGYVLGNVVPACAQCNRAKGTMPQAEFLDWVEQIHNYRNIER